MSDIFPLPPIDDLKSVKIWVARQFLKPIGYCKVLEYDEKSVKLEVVETGQYILINRRSFYFGIKNDLLTSQTPMIKLNDLLKIKYYGTARNN